MVSLNDKYELDNGQAYMSGLQALVRLPIVQSKIDKSKGINFWMRGTTLNIPNEFKNFNNNFVTIDNPFVQNKKIFQIYPINIKKTQIQDDLKIIYMSRVNISTNLEEKNIWTSRRQF